MVAFYYLRLISNKGLTVMTNKNFFQNLFSFQLPDFSSTKEQMSKGMQAMNSMAQVAVEFAQNSTRKNTEASQKQFQKTFETTREAFALSSPEDLQSLQSQYVSEAVNTSCQHAKEMIELSTNAAQEMIDMFKESAKHMHPRQSESQALKKAK